MKKFARCILILILVAILSGVGGYIYENNTMTPMYESVAKLYVVPGSQNEASIRAKNGGLNHDFMIIFSSKVVIESAQRLAGTSEDISEYLTVSSPADSNIVELKVVNPDQNTAKAYVDAVAKTAVKTTTIIPVESMQILSEGTSDGVATKPDLYYYTALIMGAACAVCVFIEIVVCLILCAFKKKEDHSDDEFEYEARFGRYAYPRREYIETEADSTKRIVNDNKRKASSDDILAAFDDDDDDEYDDSFLYQSSDNSNANVAESEKTPDRNAARTRSGSCSWGASRSRKGRTTLWRPPSWCSTASRMYGSSWRAAGTCCRTWSAGWRSCASAAISILPASSRMRRWIICTR